MTADDARAHLPDTCPACGGRIVAETERKLVTLDPAPAVAEREYECGAVLVAHDARLVRVTGQIVVTVEEGCRQAVRRKLSEETARG